MGQSLGRKLRAISCVLIFSAILPGCATTTASVVTGTDATRVACAAFSPIWWSAADSDGTIRQVKEHNAAHGALCGKAATSQTPGK